MKRDGAGWGDGLPAMAVGGVFCGFRIRVDDYERDALEDIRLAVIERE